MFTREEALRLHREMWSDMQNILGDCPTAGARIAFKHEWCLHKFNNGEINEIPRSNCFLCSACDICDKCPIAWPGDYCCYDDAGIDYRYVPISEILALPEREITNENTR